MMLERKEFRVVPAMPENVVTADNVRISLLTDRLVRFEWSADGVFEDRETLAVLNRDLGKVAFKTKTAGKKLTVETAKLRIELLLDGKRLSAANLQVFFKLNGKETAWNPELEDKGNLLGTCRTLDCHDGAFRVDWKTRERIPIELSKGYISRDGWSLIDDSRNIVLDKVKGRKWVKARAEGERQDLYLLAYGHDYTDALRDAALVFGSQPLPPRYALGYWFSRYWAYSDREIEELVDGFDRAQVPIDVMVIDMDWHLEGWTGYTWDRRYFPDPDEFLAHLHRRGCKVTLNLHPADGVGKHEEQFEAMAKAMKLDPAAVDKVPFNITDPQYMKHYFEILHHPEEKRGVDFWWMDWQQGESTAIPGLDTLPWINHLHWEDMQRRSPRRRPLIFSRFGGIGAGRYVVGFSGDTYSTWESLQYQPLFTATAANVLYGYWSHDLGGHMPGNIDPELYLRWLQYGIYSPVVRTHTTKNNDAERRFWAYAEPYSSLMAETIRKRYTLVPYIYSENRKALETGVSLCRPLYYATPEDERAYRATGEYMFGDEMLLAPVLTPVDPVSGLASQEVFLPAGEWFDAGLGRMVAGDAYHQRNSLLSETPLYVRPGTVIPGQRNADRLDDKCFKDLTMTVYPGAAGSYRLYEDDGVTTDYLEGKFVRIDMRHTKKGKSRIINVVRSEGDFVGFRAARSLEVRLEGVVPPEKVEFAGAALPFLYRFEEDSCGWRYDGRNAALVIRLPGIDLEKGAEIKVTYRESDEFLAAAGLKGIFTRLDRVATIHNSLGGCRVTKFDERLGQELAFTAVRISRKPADFQREVVALREKLPRLTGEIEGLASLAKGAAARKSTRTRAKMAAALIADC